MNLNTQDVVDYLKKNYDLLKDIADGAISLETAFQALEAHRSEAAELAAHLSGPLEFTASPDHNVNAKQRELLAKIEEVSKDIQTWQDDPDVVGSLYALRASYYTALANTYDDVFQWTITFTQQEIDDLNKLLVRAKLDAEERQLQANVVDAVVQLSKFVLSFLTTVLV
jgi:hypothetical protein